MKIEDFLELTWKNFDKFGLTQQGWTFHLDDSLYCTYGYCDGKNKLICFAEKFIVQQSKENCEALILHEIAHAMTVYEQVDHGPIWKEVCLRIGGDGQKYSSCKVRRSNKIYA